MAAHLNSSDTSAAHVVGDFCFSNCVSTGNVPVFVTAAHDGSGDFSFPQLLLEAVQVLVTVLVIAK